jgi:DNA-directed RNA polymerase specialized sigma24 family protein
VQCGGDCDRPGAARVRVSAQTSAVSGQPVPLEAVAASPHTLELAHEAHEALHVLASLKQRQRQTLAMAGFSYREIQALRGVTYTNVNRHVSEGRAMARKLRDAA